MARARGAARGLASGAARPAVVCLAGIALGACGGRGSSSASVASAVGRIAPRAESAELPSRDTFVRSPLAIDGATRARVVDAFGPPAGIDARPIRNRHVPTQTDTVVVIRYLRARFDFYVVTGGRDLLSRAVIESNRFLRYARPGIGTPVDSLVRWFGAPHERTDDTLIYHCESCVGAEEPVVFHVAGGAIRRIEVLKYVD